MMRVDQTLSSKTQNRNTLKGTLDREGWSYRITNAFDLRIAACRGQRPSMLPVHHLMSICSCLFRRPARLTCQLAPAKHSVRV